MALSVAQFRKIVAANQAKLKRGMTPVGLDNCAECKIPLQESITGNRVVIVRGKRKRFCSDCFFVKMGKEIDDYPIFMPRVRRG